MISSARAACLIVSMAAALATYLSQGPPVPQSSVEAFFRDFDSSLTSFETCLQQPVDDEHSVLIVRASRQPRETRCDTPASESRWQWGKDEAFGVFLRSRSAAQTLWVLTMMGKAADEATLRVERLDAGTLVLWKGDAGYGFGIRRFKYFFDARERRLVDRVDYSVEAGASRFASTEQRMCATVQTSPQRGLVACSDGGPFEIQKTDTIQTAPVEPLAPPSEFPPLPQSSYDDFARARPERVANNYRRGNTVIEETVGPWQRVGSRIWLGKTFYDGEGKTGVGGLGVFDTDTRRFSFMASPEIVAWSASALLVEGNSAWVGLVRHPEGADYSNGLLQIDLTSRRVERIAVADIITGIVRWRSALYLATSNGIYVVGDRSLRRFRLEPDRRGAWIIVADEVPRTASPSPQRQRD